MGYEGYAERPNQPLTDQTESSAVLGDELAGVLTALDAALELPASTLTDEGLRQWSQWLPVVSGKVAALRAKLYAEADGRLGAPGSNRLSAADLVGATTTTSPAPVRKDVTLGKWLVDFPLFAQALADGRLSIEHVTKLRRLDKARTRHDLVEGQESLITAAGMVPFRDFDTVAGYWLIRNDPDGEGPREQVRNSGCGHTTHSDGVVEGKFRFDALTGAAFRQALGAEEQRLFRLDTEEGRHRTRYQRVGAALANLVVKGSGADGTGTTEPLVSLVMSQDVAEETMRRAEEPPTEEWPVDPDDIDGRCEFADGTPVHPYFAALALSVSRFQRLVFDRNGKLIDIASAARAFPRWMRHIIFTIHRGRCAQTGCDAPFHWLQADHTIPFAKDGPTSLANGQTLCGPHNKAKTDTLPTNTQPTDTQADKG